MFCFKARQVVNFLALFNYKHSNYIQKQEQKRV